MVTERKFNSEELRREAILVLHEKLGALNTHRFLAQVSQAQGDYIKFQQRLFNGQDVDALYRAAKQHWQKRKR